MKLSRTNQKIIDAIIKKAEKICPESLALIGVYGSARTGDTHEKSDLDLLILINDDAGWQLSDGFILDDTSVGYDIYCTSWSGLEEEACCRHAHLAKLMDSEIVYVADPAAVQRLSALQAKAADILRSEKRFDCVDAIVNQAKQIYADAMTAKAIAEVRACAAYCVSLLLDAVILANGQYFHRGIKRTFEELEGLSLPAHFINTIYDIVTASEPEELKDFLTKLLHSAVVFLTRSKDKMQPSADNISGTYEEMFSNWRNKMSEAAERNDVFSSFMNLASLQLMADEIADNVSIAPLSVMDKYNPADLKQNVEAFNEALRTYLHEYQRAGIQPRHFANAEAFSASYLQLP